MNLERSIDKLETQIYNSLSEFHASMDTITNTIERNKDVKNKKVKYKEPVLYRYEKDNKITYLLPSKIIDNPHIIK